MNELKEKLININGSYFDFVLGILHYAGSREDRLIKVNDFVDTHPTASTSDVIEFVSIQPDFQDYGVPVTDTGKTSH